MKCPICKRDVEEGGADFPFCGERCRTIDLGNWATGKYVIPGPAAPAAPAGEDGEDGEG